MKKILLVSLIVIIGLLAFGDDLLAQSQSRGELYGMVVVIDPGHGGVDPGSVEWLRTSRGRERLVEDEYCYDVALRIAEAVKNKGGIPVFTVRDPDDRSISSAISKNRIFDHDRDEIFTNTKNIAISDTSGVGLRTRLWKANNAFRKYSNHKAVFLSIHFDSNRVSDLKGAHFIAPSDEVDLPDLVSILAENFKKAGYIRTLNGEEYRPVGRNGNKDHGLPELVVLRGQDNPYKGGWNRIKQKVLIELGNFSNSSDIQKLLNWRTRKNYANLIVESLVEVNNLPLSEFR